MLVTNCSVLVCWYMLVTKGSVLVVMLVTKGGVLVCRYMLVTKVSVLVHGGDKR